MAVTKKLKEVPTAASSSKASPLTTDGIWHNPAEEQSSAAQEDAAEKQNGDDEAENDEEVGEESVRIALVDIAASAEDDGVSLPAKLANAAEAQEAAEDADIGRGHEAEAQAKKSYLGCVHVKSTPKVCNHDERMAWLIENLITLLDADDAEKVRRFLVNVVEPALKSDTAPPPQRKPNPDKHGPRS